MPKLSSHSQILLGILMLSTFDGLFTLIWLDLGVGKELNPILDLCLQKGILWFVGAKSFLTLCGCSILYKTRKKKFSQKAALGLLYVYILLNLYHLLGAFYTFTN